MENTTNPQVPNNSNQGGSFAPLKNLPNAVAVLVLGICAIFPGCFCMGLIGVICGIIALILAKKDFAAYQANPNDYNPASFNNLKAGRVCAIIGLCTSGIVFLITLIYIFAMGAAFSMIPWGNLK